MNQTIINERYIKKKRLGSGGEGKVYLVEDKDLKEYVAKILYPLEDQPEENKQRMSEKIELFKKINSISSPYIMQFYEGGEGKLKINGEEPIKINYFIFDYIQNLDLYLIVKFGGPLSEKICKYIFHKIILGVKALHEAKIYHRDLKLDNIIIDDNINPKICDLDMCIYQQGKLKDQLGTKYYMPPNKLEGKEYLGDKADIYSLGCILLILVIGGDWFSNKECQYLHQYVKKNQKNKYFEELGKLSDIICSLKDDFKDLHFGMIAHNEKERWTLKDVLDSEWLKEINNMSDKKKKEIKEELEEKIKVVKGKIQNIIENNPEYLKRDGYLSSNKGIEIQKDFEFFKPHFEIKEKNIDLEDEIYIKIIGKFDFCYFMNYYVKEIKNRLICKVSIYSKFYKCKLLFDQTEKDQNKDGLIIKLSLYQTGEEEYLLRYLRISGGLPLYYEKIKTLLSIGEEKFKAIFN